MSFSYIIDNVIYSFKDSFFKERSEIEKSTDNNKIKILYLPLKFNKG